MVGANVELPFFELDEAMVGSDVKFPVELDEAIAGAGGTHSL
jgi:hypothetical protein